MSQLQTLRNKILNLDQLLTSLKEVKEANKKVVFTNGCFDILHKGHVEYLAASADQGDVLVLAINSDRSVRQLGKGENRPINAFDARATLIAALGFVDYVIEFDADTPIDLIRAIKPDVLVKGGDYDPDQADSNAKNYIVGRDVVLVNSGEVRTINLVDGFSTTNLINKMKQ
ncbi:adenylyltransferase/cytidyltransferase family protein [Crocinitomix catalasitica]|uniref:adenylyltransferase/cytidyltransferase family protein n=1 Tax=Crocinitomix catalasitica TaxID=184607 RepID=UPI00048896A8|nr:adenylyltransferase/cytidyltransferase family protein [Crocinitomix catalasitica]